MREENQEHIVILGNGIAGITAARYIRKLSDKQISVVSAESDYFFSRTALMYVYMGHLNWKNLQPYENWFWQENRINLKKARVTKVDTKGKSLILDNGDSLEYDKLILATGSIPRQLSCEGEDLKGVQTFVSKQDLELLEENTKNCQQAVIVGGGLIGVELAEMLSTRNIKVKMLLKEESYWRNVLPKEDSEFISRHLQSHRISISTNTEVDKILSDASGQVKGLITKKGKEIPCDLLCLSIGVQPNISFLKDSGIETDQGILVDPFLKTNNKDIYAIGDCARQRAPIGDRSSVEALWYTARMMGETLAQTICGNPFEYKPSHWFNSAKFFDIEYQTYGRVWPEPRENEQHLHWEHSDGLKAVTFAYNSQSGKFLGINSFGIRMRHELFDQWLNEHRSLEFVLKHLKEANFDPEFYKRYEKEILSNLKQPSKKDYW